MKAKTSIRTIRDKLRGYSFEWIYTNKSLAVISVIAAIVCWALITLYVSADSKNVIADVPIRIDTENVEEFHELQMIAIVTPEALTNSKVDVEVSGSIHEISRVTADDIKVTAQVSNVSTSGEHSLALSVTCPGHNVSVRIKDGYSFVRVWFDRVQQKKLTAEKVIVNGVSTTSDELIIGDYYSSVKSVVVQGPESVIDTVSAVYITADVNRELSATEEAPAAMCFVDASGNALPEDSSKWLTVIDYNDIGANTGTMAGEPPAGTVVVTIPIRKTAQLAINVPFKNAPEGFDVTSLKYTVTPAALLLEGDIDAISKLISAGSYTVDAVDLSTLSPGNRTFTFPLNLTTGVEELNGVTQVSVVFNMNDYSTKRFTVQNKGSFGITNADGVAADIMTDSIEIVVVGPRKQLSALSADDFVVAADMSTYDGTSGQRKMPAAIRIKGASGCWVYGTYTLTVSPRITE